MKPRDRGTIVQVGSALAYRGIPLQTAYCGAKHAIQGFHESLRCELLHEKSNVHVTMVQMPAVNTPQFSWVLSRLPRHAQPVPPIYQPEVAARGRRCTPPTTRGRREYWVGASTAATLVANAVAPGLLDRYLAAPGSPPSRPSSRSRPGRAGRTCGSRPTDPTARTSARTASSTTRPEHRAAAVGLPAPRPARRRGGRPPLAGGRGRWCWAAADDRNARQAGCRGPRLGVPPPPRSVPWPCCAHDRGRGWSAAAAARRTRRGQGPGWAATAAGHRGADPARTAVLIGGLAVDVLHATSMVAAAVIWPGYRRAALTSAAVAGASAVAGALILRGAPR